MSLSNPSPNSQGTGKWWAGFVSAFLATYIVTRMENDYHVDFTQFGMSAAVFKSCVEGTAVSFFVWVTPAHLVQSVTNAILFIKRAFKTWKDAIANPVPPEGE